MKRRRWVPMLVTGVVLALGLARCRSATYLTVEPFTNAACSDVGTTTLSVGSYGRLEDKPPVASTDRCNAQTGVIGSLVLVPSGDNDDEVALRVVTGIRRSADSCTAPEYKGCIVSRRTLRYAPDEGRTVRVFMDLRCLDVPCGPLDSCVAGRCVPARCEETPESCPGLESESESEDKDGAAPDAPGSDVGQTDGASSVDAMTDAAASLDGSRDATTRDVSIDAAPAPCPAACTGGCPAGVCTITCGATCPSGNITCPPGRDCRVVCAASDSCKDKTITCADGKKCTVECTEKDACGGNARVACGTSACRVSCGTEQDSCNNLSIDAQSAPSMCLQCRGKSSCNSLTCNASAVSCTKSCSPGNACNSIGTCGACSDVASCLP